MQFGLLTLFDFFPDRQNELAYYQDTLDLMIYAEKLGFDSVWVGEEHFYSLGICPSPQLFLTTALRAHGHHAVPPSVFVFFLFVDQDYRQALAEARETTGRYVELGLLSLFPSALAANLPANDPLRSLWERVTSMADHLEERAIIGTPRDCRRRLAEVREQWGVEHIVFYLHAGARDITRARRGLELFAREVMPEFR